MPVKEESEKVGWKLNIQKTKIIVSGPITSWQIDGGTVETVTDFIWGGSNITTDGDCSPENKRHLLHGRNINKHRYVDDTNLMGESEELKSLLMKAKEKSEKAILKLNIQKIRSWHPVPSLHGK